MSRRSAAPTVTTSPPTDDSEAVSPIGSSAAEGRQRRSDRNAAYRAAEARLAPYGRIARQLIHYRTLRGMTQEELARSVGTSVSAVSRIESGRHPTTVATLARFANAMDLELDISFRQPAREPRGPRHTGEQLSARVAV